MVTFSLTSCFLADWNTLIVGKLSPWIRADSNVEKVRRNSEAVSELGNKGLGGVSKMVCVCCLGDGETVHQDFKNYLAMLDSKLRLGHHFRSDQPDRKQGMLICLLKSV